jgi:hypothetical protein
VGAEAAVAVAAVFSPEVVAAATAAAEKVRADGGGWADQRAAARVVFDEAFAQKPAFGTLRDAFDSEFIALLRKCAAMTEAA